MSQATWAHHMESMNLEGAECRRLREILETVVCSGINAVKWNMKTAAVLWSPLRFSKCWSLAYRPRGQILEACRPRGFAQCFSRAHDEQGVRAMSSAAKSTGKAPLAAKSTVKAPAQTFGVSGRYANALWQHANKVGLLEAVSTVACSAPQVDVQGASASAGRKEEQLATAALFLPICHIIILYQSHCEPSLHVRKRLDTA